MFQHRCCLLNVKRFTEVGTGVCAIWSAAESVLGLEEEEEEAWMWLDQMKEHTLCVYWGNWYCRLALWCFSIAFGWIRYSCSLFGVEQIRGTAYNLPSRGTMKQEETMKKGRGTLIGTVTGASRLRPEWLGGMISLPPSRNFLCRRWSCIIPKVSSHNLLFVRGRGAFF